MSNFLCERDHPKCSVSCRCDATRPLCFVSLQTLRFDGIFACCGQTAPKVRTAAKCYATAPYRAPETPQPNAYHPVVCRGGEKYSYTSRSSFQKLRAVVARATHTTPRSPSRAVVATGGNRQHLKRRTINNKPGTSSLRLSFHCSILRTQ